MLRALTFIFFGISLLLWLVTKYKATSCIDNDEETVLNLQSLPHGTPESATVGGTVDDPPSNTEDTLEGVVKWLKKRLPPDVRWNDSVCPAMSDVTVPVTDPPTLTVIGAINSSFTSVNREDVSLTKLGPTGVVLTTIATTSESDQPIDVSFLEPLVPVIASLANYNIVRAGNERITKLVHALDSVSIEWLGLNAKRHRISRIGNVKVGFLAFCSISSKCTDSGFMPFAPIRYSTKVGRESVEELRKFGVDTIVVLVYWGIQHSFFPDETALYVARHLAEFPEISVIIGHHPQHVQGHAYFGKTLVLFSPGNFIVPDSSTSLCWRRIFKNQWLYRNATECLNVHPALRHGLLERELETRIYKVFLNKGVPAMSQYTTLQLDISPKTDLRVPVIKDSSAGKWTTVCGKFDSHCLSCKPY